MSSQRLVNVTCAPHCGGYPCMLRATVEDGTVVNVEPHPGNLRYPPCAKGWSMLPRLYHPDRLKYPLKRVGERGEGEWERICWDEALDTIVSELSRIKERYGNESIVFYNYVATHVHPNGAEALKYTAYRLFYLWGGCIVAHARGNHCFWAFLKSTNYMFGSRNFALPTYDKCDLIIVWGTNPAETHGRSQYQAMEKAKTRGCKFVVIDPAYTSSAAKLADVYLPIRPGGDLALALAMIHVIVKEELYDREFVLRHTNVTHLVKEDGTLLRERDVVSGGSDALMIWDVAAGEAKPANAVGVSPVLEGSYQIGQTKVRTVWQCIVDNVRDYTPEWAAEQTGLPAADIAALARDFAKAPKALIETFVAAAMNRISWGENAFYAIFTLNVITGNFDGMLPILDPKLPGVDLGIEADLIRFTMPNPVTKSFPVNHFAEAALNPSRYDTNIKAAFVMFGNPVTQNTDSNKTIRALKQLEFVCVTDVFMSDTAQYADIVLPSNTFLERAGIMEGAEIGPGPGIYRFYNDPSIKPAIFRSEAAVPSLYESKSDFQIICALAKKMGFEREFPWKDEEEWIEDIVSHARHDDRFPWLAELSSERLREEGMVFIDKPPLVPNWRFSTPSGKIELYNETLLKQGFDPLPVYREQAEGPVSTPELFAKYPLSMISGHTNLRAHSSYTNDPELLELCPQSIEIHPADAERRGINDGDAVDVFNDRGKIGMNAQVAPTIREGVVRVLCGGWQRHGSPSVLISDHVTEGYAENTTFNVCLVDVAKAR